MDLDAFGSSLVVGLYLDPPPLRAFEGLSGEMIPLRHVAAEHLAVAAVETPVTPVLALLVNLSMAFVQVLAAFRRLSRAIVPLARQVVSASLR